MNAEYQRRYIEKLKTDPVKWKQYCDKKREYHRSKYIEKSKDPSFRKRMNYLQRVNLYKKKINKATEMSDAESMKTKPTSSRSFNEVMIKENPMKLDDQLINDPVPHQQIKKVPSKKKKRNNQRKLYRSKEENENTIEESEIFDSYIGNYKTKSSFLRACQKLMVALPKDRENKKSVLKFVFYKFNSEC
ncbi:CLUMA_CG017537, isoform A [Clunio marinus]|uniref:CLUMA_CG017537, isoform A n=1 Tax=Clunio marinus TaxID=568069 RepID=A0A1J1IW65_9DIPT|nr:CLUMA_CG017537, isoform A [Clunio marinus]